LSARAVESNVIGALARFPRQLWNYARLSPVTWFEEGRLAACRYPRSDRALQELADKSVWLLINLHPVAHPLGRLEGFGMIELHLPVEDFTAPTPEQLQQGVAAIVSALESGARVAVHCEAGLGRSGTLVACYLVHRGMTPEQAIAHVRKLRPGSVETLPQEAAVRTFADAQPHSGPTNAT
jgi:atypical dual specificity phosphatase